MIKLSGYCFDFVSVYMVFLGLLYNKIPETVQFLNYKNLFSHFWRPKSSRPKLWFSNSWGPAFRFADFLPCPHTVE